MRKIVLVVSVALCMVLASFIFSGFKNNAPRVQTLQKKVATLESQIEALKKVNAAADCTVKTFESDKDLANFIVQNHNSPDFNYNTVAVDGATLQRLLTDLNAAKYKDTVFVSIVLNSNGRELMMSNIRNRICNTGFCCPPRCRYEPFGLLQIPPNLSGQNLMRNPVKSPDNIAAPYKELQQKH